MKTTLLKSCAVLATILTLLSLFGCGGGAGGDKTATLSSPLKVAALQLEIDGVAIIDNQVVVTGKNLSDVRKVIVAQGTNQHALSIQSTTDTSLVLSPLDALSFIIGATYNLIITNAYGSEVVPISFTLDANSIETNMLQDGSVTSVKLDSMNASDGQVLRYGVNGWTPSNSNERDYIGLWRPSEGEPAPVTSIGDYYLVDEAGSWQGENWDVGDQIVWNGTSWDRIPAFSPINTVFGRKGNVVAQTGDYTWNQINKTISSLFDIANVDGSGIADGKILKWDAGIGKFIVADDIDAPPGGYVAEVNGRTGQVVLTTDDVSEGLNREYFTVTRARATLSAIAPALYNDTTGVISISPATGVDAGSMSAADKAKFDSSKDNWDTAYALRERWSGVSDDLNPVLGRASLGLGTIAVLNTITSSELTDGTIANIDLAGDSVTTDKIVNGTIIVDDLADDAVTTPKIINDAVTTPKILNDAITTPKILDGAVTFSKLGTDVGAWSVLDGNVYRPTGKVGIGTSVPTKRLTIYETTGNATIRVTSADADAELELTTIENQQSQINFRSGPLGNAENKGQILYDHSDHHLAFFTEKDNPNYEKMRININGNVGIGTTAPTHLLHVAGDELVTGDLFVSGTINGYVGGTSENSNHLEGLDSAYYRDATNLDAGTVGVLRLGTGGTRDNTTYLRGDNTWADCTSAARGKISVTAPLQYDSGTGVLAIPSATGTVNGYLNSTDWTTFNNKVPTSRQILPGTGLYGGGDLSADRTLNISNSGVDTPQLKNSAVTVEKLDPVIGVWTASLGDVYRASGNVGIGTSVPETTLHISGAGPSGIIVSRFGQPATHAFLDYSTANVKFGTTGEDNLYLYTNNTVRSAITSDGRFGIGDFSARNPEAPLQVFAPAAGGDVLVANFDSDGAADTPYIMIGPKDSTHSGIIKFNKTTDEMLVSKLAGANFSKYSINTNDLSINGNVGIGTTSPGAKLHVIGGVTATSFTGDGSALTNVPATSIADNTVTSAKIVDGAVASTDIADGTIVNGDINGSAAIATSKLSGAVSSIASHGLANSAWITASDSAGASTLVQRNPSGYISNNYFNTSADVTATAASHFAIQQNSDNYIRWQTPANARASLSVPTRTGGDATGTWGINITGSAGSAPASDVYAWAKASTKPSYSNDSTIGGPYAYAGGSNASGTWPISISGNADTTDGQHLGTGNSPSFTGVGFTNAGATLYSFQNGDGWIRSTGNGFATTNLYTQFGGQLAAEGGTTGAHVLVGAPGFSDVYFDVYGKMYSRGDVTTEGAFFQNVGGGSTQGTHFGWNNINTGNGADQDGMSVFTNFKGTGLGGFFFRRSDGVRMCSMTTSGVKVYSAGDLETTPLLVMNPRGNGFERTNLDIGAWNNASAEVSLVRLQSFNINASPGIESGAFTINVKNGGAWSTSMEFNQGGGNAVHIYRDLYADATTYNHSGAWSVYSDERLKKNITPINGALEKLLDLQGVSYEWINPEEHVTGRRSGFIAQQVEESFPDWVTSAAPAESDKNLIPEGEKAKAVTIPTDFSAYVVEGIRELKSEKDREIASLKAENEELKARLEAIERRLGAE